MVITTMVIIATMMAGTKLNNSSDLEQKYDHHFAVVLDAIRELMDPPPVGNKRRIGFIVSDVSDTNASS